MRPQLLCTFTYLDRLTTSISLIYKTYTTENVSNMICYSYVESPNNVICVYNVYDCQHRLKDTISINRKKQSNTFYSINALNALIRSLNNGVLDKTFAVEWNKFEDTLLLSDSEVEYKAIKIRELAN